MLNYTDFSAKWYNFKNYFTIPTTSLLLY